MKQIWVSDSIKLIADRISEHDDPTFGPVTVFHDVPIASEMVQPYADGRAWKNRDELESYAWTVNGRWVIVGGHPEDGIISDRGQVGGRTVNPRYVKNLIDPKTERPNRAGVRADIEIFNKRVASEVLEDMKNGKKQEVSIGFFFSKDETAGTIGDGPFKGDEYDYIQRNMFHDHTAAGIDNGRCPAPYCGLGADELKKMLVGDPFAGFSSFEDCVSKMMKPKSEGGQGYSEETAKKVCGKLKAEHEDKIEEDEYLVKVSRILRALIEDEVEALRGEREAMKDTREWWMILDWKDPQLAEAFTHLDEEIKNQIKEAGLCPTCGEDAPRSEAERAMAHFNLTKEEWEKLSDEEKQEYIDKLPPRGSGGEDDEVEEESDEDLPYEDGEAIDFILTPVTEKPVESQAKKKDALDVYEVLRKSEEVLMRG